MVGVVVTVLATNLLDQAHTAVFVPVWVHEMLGSPGVLGVVFGAFGLGAVLGNLLFTVLAPKLPRLTAFRICFVLGGAPHMFVMALTDSVTAMALTLFATGVVCAAINPILSAVVYERIPRPLRGRVLGLLRAMSWAGIPIGGLLGGPTLQAIGLTAALLLTGGLYLAVTLVPVVSRHWRSLDAPAALSRTHRELVSPAPG